MTTYYNLANGGKVSIFFWDDYYTNKGLFHIETSLNEYDAQGQIKKALCVKYPKDGLVALTHEVRVREDEDGVKYIMWGGERINLEDWHYHNLSVLIDEIQWCVDHKDRWFVMEDIILASLMKQSDKFGVQIQAEKFSAIIPEMGIALSSGETTEEWITYIPKLEPLRKVEDWHYKIKLQPQKKEDRYKYRSEDYYFSDFCSMLKSGHLRLVELKGGEN